jgi:hypothetical protein
MALGLVTVAEIGWRHLREMRAVGCENAVIVGPFRFQ